MPAKKNTKITNKSIFVSSTFRDMQAERDALRDFVLPRVNEFAAKYGRAVEIIDLRWGVDTASVSEEEQSHKVLRTCLDEIERSRPFFLGLIGDRYGWTPPRTDMEAALETAQTKSSIDDFNMSVTALEIEYGVLRSETPPICLFYFRESPDYTAMPKEFCNVYKDEADGLARLEKLKTKIRARLGSDVKDYVAETHESGLTVSKNWAEMVAADIIEKLRKEWGEHTDTQLDWKEHERDIQESFRESRTAYFAGRVAAIADMTEFCLGEKTEPQLLMMQGEAGSGKSGLLCKVMDEIEDKCLLLPFCCGISPRSNLVENILRYFITLLCEKLALEDDSEGITKFQDLKDRFIELLFAACGKMRVVAIVDALDQLVGSDEARRMLWISGRLPENFRLLCSIIDGPETEAVKRLEGEIRPVPPISKEDEAAIIHGIAARHRKQIGSNVVEHILKKQTPDGAQAAQNPLYLSLIAQDLVMIDRYELDIVQQYMEGGMSHPESLAKFMRERIDDTPGDPEGAYLAILTRLEKLIARDFVRGVCGMIAVSRDGLRESDMEYAFKELEMDFNPADFSWLRQLLRRHFTQGDTQQWDFSHQSLRRALRKDRPEELERLNDGLIDHFLNVIERDDFAAREIMHHLCAANRPDLAAEVIAECYKTHDTALARGLADVYTEHGEGPVFLSAVPAGMKNVKGTDRWRITEIIVFHVLMRLPENTRPFRIELMTSAIAMLEGEEDTVTRRTMAIGRNTVANLYTEIGESKKAGEYYRKALDAREKIYEESGAASALRDLSVSYGKMGNHLTSLGNTEEAGEYYRKALDAREKIYEESGAASALWDLSASYSNMGNHLTELGNTEEAGEYYQKALAALEKIYEQSGTASALRDLSVSYSNMGNHLTELGNTEEAGEYYQKALAADKKIYDQSGAVSALRGLSVSYSNMGNHLTELGNTEEAGEYYQKALAALEKIYEQSGTASALRDLSVLYGNMGVHLTSLGRTEEAGEYYQKALAALEKIYEQSGAASALQDLSFSYRNMGDHLTSLGKTEEAGEYYQKTLDADKKIYDQSGAASALRDLSFSYERMGNHLTSLGRTEEAGEYYQKTLDADKKIYDQSGAASALRDLSFSYSNMGDHLTSLGRMEEAGEYYQKALDAAKKIYDQSGAASALRDLSFSYERMGDHLTSLGRTEEAGEYYRKALDAREKIFEESGAASALRDLSVSYGRMGNHLTSLGNTEEAGEYYQKALDADKKIFEESGAASALRYLSVSYGNMGAHLTSLGRTEEAGEYYRKTLDAREKIYEESGTASALRYLSVSYGNMGDHLTSLGRTEEAGEYYQKDLDASKKIYGQSGAASALRDLVISSDKIGDNKHALGFYEEAHYHRLKTLELFEQYVKLNPSAQKHISYYRDKVNAQ